MDRDQPGESHFAYRQWNDSPTWMMDRGRDDHGMHQSDEHTPTGFHAALVSHKDKIAQLTDASVAFITMKKTAAGLMGAVKTLGGIAAKNPHLTGAALGAGAGAIAGGPNHRLGGAAIGGGLGALGGGMVSRGVPAATRAAESTAPAAKTIGHPLANQSPAAVEAAKAEIAGGNMHGVGQAPASGPMPGSSPSTSVKTQVLPARGASPAGSVPSPPARTPEGTGSFQPPTPDPEMVRRREEGFQRHLEMMRQAGLGGNSQNSAKTVNMMKRASLPFAVADNSMTATISGELSAIKSAEVVSTLAEGAAERSGFKLPGAGSFVGVVDDLAQIGRQKLQNMLANRRRPQQEAPQPVKVASPYDSSPLMDMRQRAADRYPEVVSPVEALRTEFKSNLQLVQDKLHDLAVTRHTLMHSKEASASLDYKELAHLGGMPKQLMTRGGATAAGVGALLGGGAAYLSSRGKREHGGRSPAEVDLEKSYNRQPENPDGIRQTIGKHVIGLHKDVAEQMRKHPIAATAMGAGAGAGIALRVAPMLGLVSRVK